MSDSYPRWMSWARAGALLSTLSMLAIIAFETLLAPSGGRQPNAVVWFASSLPLLIFLPGLWRGGVRSYAWLSFVSLLYFAHAVTALFAQSQTGAAQQSVLNWLDLIASVTLFVCTLFFVRWRARIDRAAATQ